jgi:hypothetical protein
MYNVTSFPNSWIQLVQNNYIPAGLRQMSGQTNNYFQLCDQSYAETGHFTDYDWHSTTRSVTNRSVSSTALGSMPLSTDNDSAAESEPAITSICCRMCETLAAHL